jgi:hypothetical protein
MDEEYCVFSHSPPTCRSHCLCGLRHELSLPSRNWSHGFESRSRHGCLRVWVLALQQADPLSKESCLLRIRSRNWESGEGPTKGYRAITTIITVILSRTGAPKKLSRISQNKFIILYFTRRLTRKYPSEFIMFSDISQQKTVAEMKQ